MKESTIQILNKRIKAEEESSRLYEQMHLWLENESYKNAAALYKKYAQEEMSHAKWAKDYLLSFDIMPELPTLEEPMNIFSSIQEIAQLTLEHELKITQECNELGAYAFKDSDFNLLTLAQKYNAEQIEELSKAYSGLDITKMSSDKLIIDNAFKELL